MKKILRLTSLVTIIIVLIISIIFLMKDNKKNESYATHDTIIQQIEELGKLEVVKYNIQDIMEYEKVRRWLPNPRASLKIAGEVIACVDLTKIDKNDIYVKGDSVSLKLPIPEVCHYKIDHSRSRIYHIDYGFWETTELVDDAYKVAEQHIYQEAINMGIAKESRENTLKVLTPILKGLSFGKIHIEFKTPQESINRENRNIKIVSPSK